MPHDRIDGVVAAFDQHIGPNSPNQLKRSVFAEENNRIDSGEGSHDAGPFTFTNDRTRGAFESADRSVRVESKNQLRSESSALFEQRNVSHMQEVEAAVSKNDSLAGGTPLGHAQLETVKVKDLFARGCTRCSE